MADPELEVSVRVLLEPRFVASGSCSVWRKNKAEFEEFHPPLESQRAQQSKDVVEHKSRSSVNFTHNFSIVMGLGPWVCISSVTYEHTINR